MASITTSDPYVNAALWVGLIALIATLGLLLQIAWLRLRLRNRETEIVRIQETWTPQLNAVLIEGLPATLPCLPTSQASAFMRLWLRLHRSVRGEAALQLNQFALALGCDRHALRMLASGGRRDRLLATLMLGTLRVEAAWAPLSALAKRPDRLLAAQAMWALAQIKPQAAASEMLPFFLYTPQWPSAVVAAVLGESRALCEPVLAQLAQDCAPQQLPRLLQLAEALQAQLPTPLLAGMLGQTQPRVVVAALRLVNDPTLAVQTRELLAHEDWHVRVQAARALTRIGGAPEVPWLQKALGDSQWWVRLRAAEALVSLPFLSTPALQALASELPGEDERAMLKHVLARQREKQ